MGFFSKLFGKTEPAPEAPAAPVETQAGVVRQPPLDLGNGLTVHVYTHGERDIALWTMVTAGMEAHGHRELVLSLVRRPGEALASVAEPMLKLLRSIHRVAQHGQRVTWGGLTEVGEDLLAPGVRAVVYADAQPFPGVDIPDGALAMILLDREELALVKQFGLYRLLARLGRQHRRFPFPPWTDRDRKRATHAEDSKSMLGMFGARAVFQAASIVLEGEQVSLQLKRSDGEALAKLLAQVPSNVPFAISTRPARGADAWLVWWPGQSEPEATTGPTPSSRPTITGGFLGCLIDTGQPDQIIQLEDGFSLMLSAASWARCLRALAGGTSFALP